MLPLAKTVRCNGLWQLLVMGAVHTGSLLLFLCFVLERGQGASQNRASSPRLAQWLRTQRTLLDCGRVVHSVQVAEDLLCAGTCGWGSLSRRGGVSCCGRWWAGGACDERSDLEGPSQGRPGSLSRWSVVGNSPVFSFFSWAPEERSPKRAVTERGDRQNKPGARPSSGDRRLGPRRERRAGIGCLRRAAGRSMPWTPDGDTAARRFTRPFWPAVSVSTRATSRDRAGTLARECGTSGCSYAGGRSCPSGFPIGAVTLVDREERAATSAQSSRPGSNQ